MHTFPDIVRVGLDDRASWEAAVQSVPHAIAHTWHWCHAWQRAHGYPVFLFVYESDGGRVICALAERALHGYRDLFTPHGFGGFCGPGATQRFVDRWNDFATTQGYVCSYIGLHPLLIAERGAFPDAQRSTELYSLDLTCTNEELFQKFSLNRKRELRESAPTITINGPGSAEFCAERLPPFLARNNARNAVGMTAGTVMELVQHPGIVLVAAQTADSISAVLVFGIAGTIAEYIFAVSDSTREQTFTVHLLWSSLSELRARGARQLHLGGGITENDGVARFKQRFGPDRHEYFTLKQIYQPKVYQALCHAYGADSDSVGYFPAYHDPSLRRKEG